jgi:hypothetical protein
MKQIKATATEHMRRNLETVSKWTCECEACVQIPSLVGVDKVLDVRPLVRSIELTGARLDGLPAGPERARLWQQYLGLHDKLAELIAQ